MLKKYKISKPLIFIGAFLLLIGIGGLLFPYLPLRLSNDIIYLENVAEQATVVHTASVSVSGVSPLSSFNPNRPSIKNRLFMSGIGVSMPIFESKNADALVKGGWMFPGTSTPEYASNTVIFGHRFRYLPPISNTFYHLDKVKVGDQFQIQWKGITYRYRVTTVKLIEPTDLSVLAPSDKPIVTLITCAPLFSTKQRLVVVGELLQ